MKRILSITLLSFTSVCLLAQYSIIGEWKSCYAGPNYDTSFSQCDVIEYHQFLPNNIYSDSKIPAKFSGTWHIINGELRTSWKSNSGHSGSFASKMKWINENLFYRYGQEDGKGPYLFTFFKRVK